MGRTEEWWRRLGHAASARAGGVRDALEAMRERALVAALAPYIEQVERLKWRLTRLDGRVNYALLGAPRRDDATAREVSHALLASRTRLRGAPDLGAAPDATPELLARRLGVLGERAWPGQAALRRVLLLGPRSGGALALAGRWPDAAVTLVDADGSVSHPAGPALEVVATDPITALLARGGAGFDAVVALDVYQRLSPWERLAFFELAWACVGARGALYAELPNTANLEVLTDRFWRDPRHLVPVSATAVREAVEALPGARAREVGCWEGELLLPWEDPARAPARGSRLFALALRG